MKNIWVIKQPSVSSICLPMEEIISGFFWSTFSRRCLEQIRVFIWASPENSMKASYKMTTDGLKDLPRKVAMARAKGTLDFAKGVS